MSLVSLVRFVLEALQPCLLLYSNRELGDSENPCNQLLGFDVILSSDGTPYILEVNGNPALKPATETDWDIKLPLMNDILQLVRTDVLGSQEHHLQV